MSKPVVNRRINVKTGQQQQPQAAIRKRGKAVVHKTNYIGKAQKAVERAPKAINTKSVDAYSRKRPAVVPKARPIREVLDTKRKPKERISQFGNRRLVRQEIKKPRRNIIESVHNRYSEKAKVLRNIGENRILIMLACGPSLLEAPIGLMADDPNIDFMAINRPYGYYSNQVPKEHAKIWPTKFWSFCDQSQFRRNTQAWESYKGTIINSPAVRARHPNQVVIKHRPGKGFSRDMSVGYHIGRSSTYAAMQVAYWMNYKKIYIFGIDMCAVGDKLHHYGKNPDVDEENRKRRFTSEAEHYNYAAQNLTESERQRYTICSSYNPFRFVDSFEKLDQKEAPKIILERSKVLIQK